MGAQNIHCALEFFGKRTGDCRVPLHFWRKQFRQEENSPEGQKYTRANNYIVPTLCSLSPTMTLLHIMHFIFFLHYGG